MPRRPRDEVEGGLHHVYARGVDRRLIFSDDADRAYYLSLLGGVVVGQGWRCLSYCLMPNHVHLLVETPKPNLAPGIQRLHGVYAGDFNKRHARSGHLFQGRYGSTRIEDDVQLSAVVGYIPVNPVKAGLCDRAETWPWSSHVQTVEGAGPRWLAVERLLQYLTGWGDDPRRSYVELVESRVASLR